MENKLNNNISRRELAKFIEIVEKYQPDNKSLYSILNQYIYRKIDIHTLNMFNTIIDALFNSLDYPTEEWAMNDTNMLTNYKLVKDSIIEYCVTDVKDISTIIDNVAFFNSMEIEDVEKRLNIYMSSYGDTSKVMNVFSRYSEDYINNIRKSNLPETYIPIFSKAVAQKIKEMQNNRQK